MSLNGGKITSLTSMLAALECQINHFFGSSSLLQATRTPIKSLMGSKFGQIRPWTVELAVLEHLENPHRLIMRVIL